MHFSLIPSYKNNLQKSYSFFGILSTRFFLFSHIIYIGTGDGLLPNGTKPLPIQFWPLISQVLWHSYESNFTSSVQATILYNEPEYHTFSTIVTSTGGQWVNCGLVHGGAVTSHKQELPVRRQIRRRPSGFELN